MAKTEKHLEPTRSSVPAQAHAPRPVVLTMPVDIHETDDGLVLRADLPGAAEKDLQVRLEQGVLTIEAPTHVQPGPPDLVALSEEFQDALYRRSFAIGTGIDPNRIEGKLKDGVLTLKLPKAEQARTRKIPIRPA